MGVSKWFSSRGPFKSDRAWWFNLQGKVVLAQEHVTKRDRLCEFVWTFIPRQNPSRGFIRYSG